MPHPTPALPHWPYPRWIAHRGAGKLAPENTLAAFRLGASHGYRMFECDVKLSADDVPFLLHDDSLQRTTNAQKVLVAPVQIAQAATELIAGKLDWRALSRLDAGAWHSRGFAGEPLPTLAGIAAFCIANGYHLNIEIKPTPGLERHTGEVVAQHAARLWQGQTVPPLLTSFEPLALQGALHAQPELPRGLLLDTLGTDWLAQAQSLACVAVVCNYRLWNAQTVDQVHQAGMRALSYTVNDDDDARTLQGWGTDGIITDRVDHFAPSR